jgi:hypothetical protein
VRVVALGEDDVPLLERNSEVLLVPGEECLRITRPKEDSTDAGDPLHEVRLTRARMGGVDVRGPSPAVQAFE